MNGNARNGSGLRVMIYDRTCGGRGWRVGLSRAWWAGAALYSALGRLDASRGVDNWTDALKWLATVGGDTPLREVQFWGHGKWGRLMIDGASFDVTSLERGSEHAGHVDRIASRLSPSSLFWSRTCETFGANSGQLFARSLADRLNCRVAGHTYIIGAIQSGLHSLNPGKSPGWRADEGLLSGTPATPKQAAWSMPDAPNTITFLQGRIPEGF